MDLTQSKKVAFPLSYEVNAFGECKSLREWFADARSGCCNFPAFRYRFAAIGMSATEAIETPRIKKERATVDAGKRCGKLVSTGKHRRLRHATEVLCDCDCGQQVWRNVHRFSVAKRMSCGCGVGNEHEARDKKAKRSREWHQANKDRHREYMRQWKENNPHLVSKHQFYRRKASVVSAEEAAAIKQIYNLAKSNLACVCYLCGSITGKAERQVDHSLPICRGGDHSAANLAIACTDCNLRKHAKTELEFLLQEHEIEGPLLV